MIIKKYVADTMNEALSMIKMELGSEAIIVSKRSIKQRGFLGRFLPKRLEVTAAIDDGPKKEPVLLQKSYASLETNNSKAMESELNEVKEMLQKLIEDKDKGKDKEIKKDKRIGIKKLLIERDVSEEVIESLAKDARKKEKYKDMPRLTDSVILEEIGDILNVDCTREGRVHAFIGPTGVGKTTTIAKIAALEALNTKKKVGLITVDTYRIGAVEQLKIYADILGLPFEVINSTDDIDRAFDHLKDCDSIFLDTTGRSIKNIMQLSELKLYLDRIKPDTIYLVVSMTTKYHDLMQILDGFETMDYSRIILTKFDETTTYGSALNAAYCSKAPISYITTGQNVPDDIREASKDTLLELIVGGGSI